MDKKQLDKSLQLETPAQPNLRQLVSKLLSSGNKWRLTLLIIILLVIVGEGAYLLGAKQSKLNQQTTIIPTNVQISPTPDMSATPLPTGELTPNPTITRKFTDTAKNPNWGNLNWIIIFTNAGEPLPENLKSDLCNGSGTNKFSYLPTWFKREANKYGVSLSMSLKCYDQQIALPQSVITTTDTYTAFGQAISNPLDMQKTTNYLTQTIPSLVDYDLITVVHYRGPGGSTADLASIGSKISYTFIAKSNLIDGVQYYAPNITEPNLDADAGLIKGVAHEAFHSLRAKDHYDFNNFSCSDELDKSVSRSFSIMCAGNFNNFTDYIVSPQTAKEIGWTN